MIRILLSLTIFLSFYALTYSQPIQQQWVRTFYFDGSFGSFVNTDLAGNVYVVGSFSAIDYPWFMFIQKFSPSGTQLYSTVVDTPCRPVAVFLDSAYSEYITGYNFAWAPPRSTVLKYNSSGALLWRILEPITGDDAVRDMAGDTFGNSHILRYKNGLNQILKYNSSGVQQLLFNIADTIRPYRIWLDNQNNIIVNGDAYLSGNIYAIITIKYTASGVKLWKSTYIPPSVYSTPLFSRIRTGSAGNIYIMASISLQPFSSDYAVIKYNSSGIQQWIATYNRFQSDEVRAMCIDSLENTYVTGFSGTVKFNASGLLQWTDTTQGNINALILDKYNNIYLTGSVGNLSMMKTIKLDNSGSLLWSITYSTGSPYSDYSNAIALDTSRNVFITGLAAHTPLSGYLGHAATIKYSQPVGVQPTSNEIPSSFKLYQNYPNPFNSTTKIRFDIPVETIHELSLRIYDLLGQEIRTLVNEQLKPGTYEVEWDATNYPSGVYFYKLIAGDFSETKKLVVLK